MPAQTIRPARLLRASLLTLALAAGLASTAHAEARPIAAPAGDLDAALKAVAAQTGQQLLYTPDLVAGRTTAGLSGRFEAEEAVTRLLQDERLVVTRVSPTVLTIKRRPANGAGDIARVGGVLPGAAVRDPATIPAPLPDARRPFAAEAAAPPGLETASAAQPTVLEELRVTGSNIRGAPPASPLLVLDRAALEATGHGTLAAALNTLPQVFGGQATEGTSATRADLAGANATFATSVNLRGLGPSATLVLVNGRRVSGAGFKGDFVDLTTIPTVAVERVEVLLDGASAIYGADAVGGVVNIVLRKTWEGLELRLRGGAATAGEPREGQLGLAFGRTWTGGGMFAAYEANRRTRLSAEDRAITADADLRPFGGSDRRETYAFPGNILGINPATGVNGPLYGIPTGQAGTGLTPASFQAGVINRQTPHLGVDILPDQRQHSLYLAAWQDLTHALELSGDLRWSVRKAEALGLPSIATLTVSRANPFYVSPTGAVSQQIAYSFAGELGAPPTYRRVDSLTGTLAADLRLPGDWRAGAYLGASREKDGADSFGVVNSAILAEALGNVADRPETAYSPARDGYFNPYTAVPANPAAVLNAIASGFSVADLRTETYTANLQADGPLFDLPAGALRLAVGAQARRESFETHGTNFLSTVAPVAATAIEGDRDVLAAFAELRAPLTAEDAAVGAVDLSLAGRVERYSDFGSAWSPKFGLTWTPRHDLRLRGTWGRSFRAPGLRDLYAATFNSAINVTTPAGTQPVLSRQGGNPDLEPETARSWTVGGEFRPAGIEGLRLGATWFDIRFKDRIDRPAASNTAQTLVDPRFAPFVQRLSPRTNPGDLALVRQILADPATRATTVAPEAFVALVDLRFVNSGGLTVRGLDVEGEYRRPALAGDLGLGVNATWLKDYRQQLTPTAAGLDVVGRVGLPAELRGRAAADWRRGPLLLGVAANYTSAFHDAAGVRIDDLLTWDAQAGWTPKDGPLQGLALRLTVRNLFDTDPPFYDNPFGFAYDPASGDPVGRFVALQLTRTW
jgi:outer membrane receptor protein involved in Fe transport